MLRRRGAHQHPLALGTIAVVLRSTTSASELGQVGGHLESDVFEAQFKQAMPLAFVLHLRAFSLPAFASRCSGTRSLASLRCSDVMVDEIGRPYWLAREERCMELRSSFWLCMVAGCRYVSAERLGMITCDDMRSATMLVSDGRHV